VFGGFGYSRNGLIVQCSTKCTSERLISLWEVSWSEEEGLQFSLVSLVKSLQTPHLVRIPPFLCDLLSLDSHRPLIPFQLFELWNIRADAHRSSSGVERGGGVRGRETFGKQIYWDLAAGCVDPSEEFWMRRRAVRAIYIKQQLWDLFMLLSLFFLGPRD